MLGHMGSASLQLIACLRVARFLTHKGATKPRLLPLALMSSRVPCLLQCNSSSTVASGHYKGACLSMVIQYEFLQGQQADTKVGGAGEWYRAAGEAGWMVLAVHVPPAKVVCSWGNWSMS